MNNLPDSTQQTASAESETMKVYNYFRSGTSHRLRIAMNLKRVSYDYVAVNLRTEEHFTDSFKAINPQGFVPAVAFEDHVLIQSPAIIEWLEERFTEPPLLPVGSWDRQYVRSLAAIIGCDIHPINNRRILETLRQDFGASPARINQWCDQWISAGFDAFLALLATNTRRDGFCFGNTPGLADVYLIPQLESARRFNVDLTRWPLLQAIESNCMQLDAFMQAAPTAQSDARFI